MMSIYESDYGLVHYEDAYHNDYQQGRRIIFTNPYQDDGDRRSWNSSRNLWATLMLSALIPPKAAT